MTLSVSGSSASGLGGVAALDRLRELLDRGAHARAVRPVAQALPSRSEVRFSADFVLAISSMLSLVCSEISGTKRSRTAVRRAVYSTARLAGVNPELAQPLAGQVRLVARRVLADHVAELHDPLRALAELQVGVALLEQGARHLVAARVALEHGVELLDRLAEAPLPVVGLADPVGRVVGQVGLGEVRQVLLERRAARGRSCPSGSRCRPRRRACCGSACEPLPAEAPRLRGPASAPMAGLGPSAGCGTP